jgi:hypothetical protein
MIIPLETNIVANPHQVPLQTETLCPIEIQTQNGPTSLIPIRNYQIRNWAVTRKTIEIYLLMLITIYFDLEF